MFNNILLVFNFNFKNKKYKKNILANEEFYK